MRVAAGRAGEATERRTGTFSGEVWADPVLLGEEGVTVNTVLFMPGARTYWHRHEVAQILTVSQGEGWLQRDDGAGLPLGVGSVAHIAAGEVHWHGATPGSSLVHVAISVGTTEWLHEVSEAEYAAAFADRGGRR